MGLKYDSNYYNHGSVRSIRPWRGLRLPLQRLITVVGVVSLMALALLHLRWRGALHDKYTPTTFATLDSKPPQTAEEDQARVATRSFFLANRAQWKKLGGGCEGTVYAYNNSVIKIFNERLSPARNCDPAEPGHGIPAEIPATLLLGGTITASDEKGPQDGNQRTFADMFIPIRDYFVAVPPGETEPQWHLITPFLRGGTLERLGEKMEASAEDYERLTFHQLDAKYRASFESILSALHFMHKTHGLCHDDMKPDNIFLASEDDTTRWKLGDLGMVREQSHPYHSSLLWSSDMLQHPDCFVNDVHRWTKTYASFIRTASTDKEAFDEAFFEGDESLSKMYWSVTRFTTDAARAIDNSRAFPPAKDSPDDATTAKDKKNVYDNSRTLDARRDDLGHSQMISSTPIGSVILGRPTGRTRDVTHELRLGQSEFWAKVFGMTGLLGRPTPGCKTNN